jgi:hypothetical protein
VKCSASIDRINRECDVEEHEFQPDWNYEVTMAAANDSIPGELIRWMEVPRHPNVLALGNFGRQVTFSAQQTRAFNLVWALFSTNRLAAGSRVAVVGAGLGGMTAALAAHAKGCDVHLYEQASQPCPLQRGNDIRFIHPNILRWPEEGFDKAQTDFPFLNWTAATVRGVIKQIDLQWKRHVAGIPRLRLFFNYKVNRLYVSPRKSGPQRPWLAANRVIDGNAAGDETADGKAPSGYLEFSYDCVILAVGFGEERSVSGVPFLSYWENDSLHQEMVRSRRSILVSGCGDGGLIDALRLRLRNFEHAKFVRDFLTAAKSKSLIEELQAIDRDLRRQANAPDISLRFHSRYEDLPVPEEVERYFLLGKRTDAVVTLNSPAPGPLTFKASLLNRYAAYLAMRYADLHYLSGRIVAQRVENSSYQVTFQRDDTELSETQSFDLVIVRHGPQGVINNLVPASVVKELEGWWGENEDITTRAHWRTNDNKEEPHKFFSPFQSESIPPADDVLDLALATFDTAYREFCLDPEIQSIGIGKHEGKAGFIVTLKPGAPPRQSSLYATNVLVQYVTSPVTSPPARPTKKSTRSTSAASQDHRFLRAGSGIYNYDAQNQSISAFSGALGQLVVPSFAEPHSGRDESYLVGTGTLGCFGVDVEGEKYLLSAYAFGVSEAGKVGDRIYLEGQSPETGHFPVAKLKVSALLPQAQEQTTDPSAASIWVIAACLEPDVQPDYASLPPAWRPRRIDHAANGNRVAKVGRTSGVTNGIVLAVLPEVSIIVGNSGRIMVSDCMLIAAEDGSEFSMPGDSGAVVVRDDGAAIGIVIARSQATGTGKGTTVAFPLERALKCVNLKLLSVSNGQETEGKLLDHKGSRRQHRRNPNK